jgi:polar amino acid transport system substrate-binding protein
MKRAISAALVTVGVTALAGCGTTINTNATSSGSTPAGVVSAAQVLPAGAQQIGTPQSSAGAGCTASLAPSGPLPAPGQMPTGSWMAEIAKRGYLNAGVDQNTLFWGYRQPGSASPQGFDVDMVKQVAIAIFGDDSAQHLHLIVVPNADRQQEVADGTVDLLAETMTITCDRQDGSNGLPAVDFSSEYYVAHQEVLVPKESAITSIDDLNGKRVCAVTTSTSLTTVKQAAPQVQLWEAPNETDCLVMLQQGQVDAISTDDTILEGFAAQDPNLKVLPIQLADEPYGMAISNTHPDFVRFVNAVLAHEEADGTWATIWTEELKTSVVALPRVRYRSS